MGRLVVFRTRFAVVLSVLFLAGSVRANQDEERASTHHDANGDSSGADSYETVVAGRRRKPGQVLEHPGEAGTTVSGALSPEPALWVHRTVRGEMLVNLLGFDQRRLLVTIQGVPLLLPYDGFVDLGRFPAGFISRIRLRKGPSSLAFGPGGMGGSIDLELASGRDAPPLDAWASLAPEAWDVHCLSGGTRAGLSWSLGAQLSKTKALRLSRFFRPGVVEDGGLRENSDRETGALGLNFRWTISRNQDLSFFALGTLGSLGVPPSTSGGTVRYWRFADHRLGLSGVGYRRQGHTWSIRSGLFIAGYGNTVDSYDDSSYLLRRTDRAFHSLFRDSSFGGYASIQWRLPFADVVQRGGALLARAWADVRRDRHHQVLDGVSMPVMGTTLLRFIVEAELDLPAAHRLGGQVEILGEKPASVTIFTEDAGGNKGKETFLSPPVWTANPIVTYQGRLPPVSLTASAARRTRFPTLKERFSDGLGRRIPNPGLRPETAWVGRITAGLPFLGMFIVRWAVFGALIDDVLEQRPAGEGKVRMDNVGRGVLSGTEVTIAFLWRWISLTAGYRFLYSRILSGVAPMDSLPRHRGLIRARVAAWSRLEAQATLAVTGPFSATDPDSGLSSWLAPALVLDAFLQVQVARYLFVFARASNVLDWNYETSPGQPAPGLNLWCGLRVLVR